MGNSSSSASSVSTDDIASKIRKVNDKEMTARDRRLFNFANMKIVEEKLDEAEVTVAFEDRKPIIVTAGCNPSAKVWIGFNGNEPQMIRQERNVWKTVKHYFVQALPTLIDAVVSVFKNRGKAIAWR